MINHGFPQHWSTIKKLIWAIGSGVIGGASAVWKTVTGALIHLTDALASPMQKCEVTLEPIQTGSGDPSPTNIRPITGWTGCNVEVTGKNLFGIPSCDGKYTVSGTGEKTEGNDRLCSKFIPVINGNQFTFSINGSNGFKFYSIAYYDENKNYIDRISGSAKTVTTNFGSSCKYIKASFQNNTNAEITATVLNNREVQLEVGSSKTTYEEFSGKTNPISWQTEAGTVYGATLTINEDGSVDLQLTYGGIIYTSENIKLLSTGNNYLRVDTGISNSLNNWQAPSYCSHYKINGSPIGIVGSNDNRRFWINAQDLNNPTVRANVTNDNIQDYRDYFIAQAENGTPLTIVWQLKRNIPEPIHLQSIEQIYTLVGENNIWADVNGEITLTYLAQAE